MSDVQQNVGRPWAKTDRVKISLMQVFRSHHAQNRPAFDLADQRRGHATREGISDAELRVHIADDLASLLSTVRLDACFQDEDDPVGRSRHSLKELKSPWRNSHPYLAKSILNYGFCDLSDVTTSDFRKPDMVQLLRESLIAHEPRLAAETIQITIRTNDSGRDHLLSLHVQADLIGDPVDIPVDFDADVDLGAGKLRMSAVRVQI